MATDGNKFVRLTSEHHGTSFDERMSRSGETPVKNSSDCRWFNSCVLCLCGVVSVKEKALHSRRKQVRSEWCEQTHLVLVFPSTHFHTDAWEIQNASESTECRSTVFTRVQDTCQHQIWVRLCHGLFAIVFEGPYTRKSRQKVGVCPLHGCDLYTGEYGSYARTVGKNRRTLNRVSEIQAPLRAGPSQVAPLLRPQLTCVTEMKRNPQWRDYSPLAQFMNPLPYYMQQQQLYLYWLDSSSCFFPTKKRTRVVWRATDSSHASQSARTLCSASDDARNFTLNDTSVLQTELYQAVF